MLVVLTHPLPLTTHLFLTPLFWFHSLFLSSSRPPLFVSLHLISLCFSLLSLCSLHPPLSSLCFSLCPLPFLYIYISICIWFPPYFFFIIFAVFSVFLSKPVVIFIFLKKLSTYIQIDIFTCGFFFFFFSCGNI